MIVYNPVEHICGGEIRNLETANDGQALVIEGADRVCVSLSVAELDKIFKFAYRMLPTVPRATVELHSARQELFEARATIEQLKRERACVHTPKTP